MTEDVQAKIEGVIFDVDGTLLDSNDAHAQAWVDAMTEHGYKVTHEEIHRLIGMGGDKLLPTAIKVEKDSPEGKQLSERRKQIFNEKYLPTLKPVPGTRDLLQKLRDMGLKLVVATSAQPEELKDLLKAAGASEFFAETTTSGDVKNSKPDPDIIQVALDKLKTKPANALMIGDTPYDIESAAKAGVATIAFRSGGWNNADLKGAIAIYDNGADLMAHFADSPFSQRLVQHQ